MARKTKYGRTPLILSYCSKKGRKTGDVGHPRLREHLASVITLMKAAAKWDDFKRLLERALPKYGDLPLIEYGERQAEEKKEQKQ